MLDSDGYEDMGVIEDLPDRPLRANEVQAFKEHPKIESSVALDRAETDEYEGGTITLIVLVSGNAVALNLSEDGWGKVVLDRNVSKDDFEIISNSVAEDYYV